MYLSQQITPTFYFKQKFLFQNFIVRIAVCQRKWYYLSSNKVINTYLYNVYMFVIFNIRNPRTYGFINTITVLDIMEKFNYIINRLIYKCFIARNILTTWSHSKSISKFINVSNIIYFNNKWWNSNLWNFFLINC